MVNMNKSLFLRLSRMRAHVQSLSPRPTHVKLIDSFYGNPRTALASRGHPGTWPCDGQSSWKRSRSASILFLTLFPFLQTTDAATDGARLRLRNRSPIRASRRRRTAPRGEFSSRFACAGLQRAPFCPAVAGARAQDE